MPIEFRKVHELNNKAVMDNYGFESNMSKAKIVAELMKLYQEIIDKEKQTKYNCITM